MRFEDFQNEFPDIDVQFIRVAVTSPPAIPRSLDILDAIAVAEEHIEYETYYVALRVGGSKHAYACAKREYDEDEIPDRVANVLRKLIRASH